MPTSELKKGALVERIQPSAGRRPATLSPVETELKQVALCPDDVPSFSVQVDQLAQPRIDSNR